MSGWEDLDNHALSKRAHTHIHMHVYVYIHGRCIHTQQTDIDIHLDIADTHDMCAYIPFTSRMLFFLHSVLVSALSSALSSAFAFAPSCQTLTPFCLSRNYESTPHYTYTQTDRQTHTHAHPHTQTHTRSIVYSRIYSLQRHRNMKSLNCFNFVFDMSMACNRLHILWCFCPRHYSSREQSMRESCDT